MYRLLAGCLVASLMVGCGGGESARVLPTEPVTGVVTYNGSPVAGATIVFAPVATGEDSFAATAMTDAQGKYTLSTAFGATTTNEGAVAGEYIVTIVKSKASEAAAGSSSSSPDPNDIAAQMGAANKERRADSSTPRMGPMGRPASSSQPAGMSQEDSAIPVAYAAATTTPLKGVQVPGGTYDFSLVDDAK